MSEELWAVHVKGTGDIIAATSKGAAERLKNVLAGTDVGVTDGVLVNPVVIEWPGSATAHAADLERRKR